jgi:glycosyltransferase involved in cell wall biosynthesis
MTGYFSEPLAFGMRSYNLLHSNKGKYDVIHDNQTLAYGMLKLQKLGFPIVETIHHAVTIDRDLAIAATKSIRHKRGLRRWFSFVNMQIKVARQLSHIITVSQTASQHISEVFQIPQDRMRVIYNGIDTNVFSPSNEVSHLPNRILAVISRDTPVKGLKYILEALAVLRKEHDLELQVIGKTLGDGITEEIIHNLGIADHVSFIDQIDTAELVRHYRLATIVAVPSIYEGFGLPAAEGMACGTPVVATTAGALPEVVGDAGILVPPADVPSLVEAISGLMDNPDKRNHLGETGRKRIEQLFTWKNAAKRTADVYLEAIEYQKYNNKL